MPYIYCGNVEVVKALFDAGASLEAGLGVTQLVYLASCGNVPVIKALFEADRASRDKYDLLSQTANPMSQMVNPSGLAIWMVLGAIRSALG